MGDFTSSLHLKELTFFDRLFMALSSVLENIPLGGESKTVKGGGVLVCMVGVWLTHVSVIREKLGFDLLHAAFYST